MKISSVHIINYKSFADSGRIALSQVNLLVGRNNNGKSAFIRATHLMQKGAYINGNDVRLGEEKANIDISITVEGRADFQRYYGKQVDETQQLLSFALTRAGRLSFLRPSYIHRICLKVHVKLSNQHLTAAQRPSATEFPKLPVGRA